MFDEMMDIERDEAVMVENGLRKAGCNLHGISHLVMIE